ncbi:baseplate hub [Ralstonia phage PQ43W]
MDYQPLTVRQARVTVSVTRPNTSGQPTVQTYVFQQHRMHITVRQGGQQFQNAKVEVYGVALVTMNQIARLWLESLAPSNSDTLAIDVWDGQTFVPFFQGVIAWSAVDASGMPHVKLVLEANASMLLANTVASPYANAGPTSLQNALTNIVQPAGFALDYSATAPQYLLTDVRASGTPLEQVGHIMSHFPDLAWFVNLQRLVVTQANAPYDTNSVRIAPETGMMASPAYSTSGIQFNTVFDPRLRPGTSLDVHTQFDYINRTVWVARVLAHQLEPNVPGGAWLTSVAANSYGSKGNAQN